MYEKISIEKIYQMDYKKIEMRIAKLSEVMLNLRIQIDMLILETQEVCDKADNEGNDKTPLSLNKKIILTKDKLDEVARLKAEVKEVETEYSQTLLVAETLLEQSIKINKKRLVYILIIAMVGALIVALLSKTDYKAYGLVVTLIQLTLSVAVYRLVRRDADALAASVANKQHKKL